MTNSVTGSGEVSSSKVERAPSFKEHALALFGAILVCAFLWYLLPPFLDWSSDELRRLPPARGQWEVIKSAVPFAVGWLTWLAMLLSLQRRSNR